MWAFRRDRYLFFSFQYFQWLLVVSFWRIGSRGGQCSTARDDDFVKGDKNMPIQQEMSAAAFLRERMRGRQLP
jgi:hypothetical protein